MTDAHFETLVSIANTLRGMNFDRRIPEDARAVLHEQVKRLDAVEEDVLASDDDPRMQHKG